MNGPTSGRTVGLSPRPPREDARPLIVRRTEEDANSWRNVLACCGIRPSERPGTDGISKAVRVALVVAVIVVCCQRIAASKAVGVFPGSFARQRDGSPTPNPKPEVLVEAKEKTPPHSVAGINPPLVQPPPAVVPKPAVVPQPWDSSRPAVVPPVHPRTTKDSKSNSRTSEPAPVSRRRGSFLVVGNWGLGDEASDFECQAALANRMLEKMQELGDVQFVINTGDSFWPNGVSSAEDAKWYDKWQNVFPKRLQSVPWYSVYGNHDYRGDPCACSLEPNDCAQINKDANRRDRFYMPDFSWSRKHSDLKLEVVALDLNKFVNGWRKNLSAEELIFEDCKYTNCEQHCLRNANVRAKKALELLGNRVKDSDAEVLLVFSHYPTDYMSSVPEFMANLSQSDKKQITYFGSHKHSTHNNGARSVAPNTNWIVGSGGHWSCDGEQMGFVVGEIDQHYQVNTFAELVGKGHCGGGKKEPAIASPTYWPAQSPNASEQYSQTQSQYSFSKVQKPQQKKNLANEQTALKTAAAKAWAAKADAKWKEKEPASASPTYWPAQSPNASEQYSQKQSQYSFNNVHKHQRKNNLTKEQTALKTAAAKAWAARADAEWKEKFYTREEEREETKARIFDEALANGTAIPRWATRRGSFLVIGDWGWDGTVHGNTYSRGCQTAISEKMSERFEELGDVQFIINVGDSFYPDGVTSKEDPQWNDKWRTVYSPELRSVPWYSVYGNHDYHKDPCACSDDEAACAQVNYDWYNRDHFYMPGVSWFREHTNLDLEVIGLDLNKYVLGYQKGKPMEQLIFEDCNWTPCKEKCIERAEVRAREALKLFNERIEQATAKHLLVFSHYPTDYLTSAPGFLANLSREDKSITYFGGHRHDVDDTSTTPTGANQNWLVGGGGGWGCDGHHQGFVVGEIDKDFNVITYPVFVDWHQCCPAV